MFVSKFRSKGCLVLTRVAYSAPEVKGVFDPSKSNFDYRVNSMVSKS